MGETAYLIYDGECPFCTRYARLTRLRATLGELRIVNARDGGPQVDAVKARGLEIDAGMVLRIDDRFYHGADCLHRLALLSSRSGLFNRLTYAVFRHERLARFLYPILRAGRNLVLKMLGRKPMGF